MENGPKYTLIGSGVVVVISVILFVFGSTVDIDVESEAVFKGTEGTVSLSEGSSYTVFVNEQFDCYDTDVVITDGTTNYFDQDCDEYMDEKGWKHAGVLPVGTSGNLEVTSNHEIIIVDEMVITGYELDQRARMLTLLNAPGNTNDLAREQLVDDRGQLRGEGVLKHGRSLVAPQTRQHCAHHGRVLRRRRDGDRGDRGGQRLSHRPATSAAGR